MMYEITAGIPKPETVRKKGAGAPKYPFAEMKVGDSFIVPYGDMNQGETSEKFRNRIYKSARNYALRDYNERMGEFQKIPNGERKPSDQPTKKDFSAAVMDKDDDQDPKRFVQGDVVVWRDA